LRESKELHKDAREKFGGKPLRQSWELPFLFKSISLSKSTGTLHCLYEAQLSVAVAGIDHSVWVAYGFVDTYYESEGSVGGESVDTYHRLKGRPDPLTAGQISANNPIWTPREYFLRVLEIRINQIRGEWHYITDKVVDEAKQYVYCMNFVSNVLVLLKLDLGWETRISFLFFP